jgi:hypothetical protein
MQIWRGESHFSQKWPLANVSKYGESLQSAWRMLVSLASLAKVFGECRQVLHISVSTRQKRKFLASTCTRQIRA